MKTNKSYLLISAVLTLLFFLPPTQTLAQENIIDRLDKSLGVKLPAEYDAKVREFTKTNKIMKDEGSNHFIEQFIGEQMETDWGIDRPNQLLFVWHSIYKQITKNDLYDTNDKNQQRLNDFNGKKDRINNCGSEFKNVFKEYINIRKSAADQRSAEAQQRIAEADQRIAEADQQIAAADQQIAESRQETIKSLNNSLNLFKEFYLSYKQLPNEEQLRKFKENAQKLLPLWKKYEVDYKKTLTPEMLKFYGIE